MSTDVRAVCIAGTYVEVGSFIVNVWSDTIQTEDGFIVSQSQYRRVVRNTHRVYLIAR